MATKQYCGVTGPGCRLLRYLGHRAGLSAGVGSVSAAGGV